jgi:HD-like signal output (HDOD) protein
MVLPQLLRAVRSDETSKQELVQIIMQDPVITGDVLKMANSSYYRISAEPVETIGRAVVVLGMDGLKSLISASVMQPVFQVPKGYFDDFSKIVWEHAFHSALGAQIYARKTRSCDSFTAHLLGLVTSISYIVLFRLGIDVYTGFPGILPRTEVFVRIMDESAGRITLLIAEDWQLGPHIVGALKEYLDATPVNRMSPLARALYFGSLGGAGALLCHHRLMKEEKVLAIMVDKGLDEEVAQAIWQPLIEYRKQGD